MNELNIYQRLLKITEELATVKKGLIVGSGSYGYKAVGEMDILNAVKPLEIEHGVYSYPMNRSLVTQEVLTTEKNDKVSTKFMMRVETTYRFVNVDKPSEFVDQVSYGDGVDSLDKSPGKAMTYSDKYSLMKAYKIMTGDDPDQKHSNDTKVVKKTYTKKPVKPPQKETYSSHGGKTEEDAKKSAIKDGLDKISKMLEQFENIEYKSEVIKNVCGIYEVKEWKDITFNTNPEYKKLLSIVDQELQKEKDLQQAGI